MKALNLTIDGKSILPNSEQQLNQQRLVKKLREFLMTGLNASSVAANSLLSLLKGIYHSARKLTIIKRGLSKLRENSHLVVKLIPRVFKLIMVLQAELKLNENHKYRYKYLIESVINN